MPLTVLTALVEAGRITEIQHQQFRVEAAARGVHPVLLAFERLDLDWAEVAEIVGSHSELPRVDFQSGSAPRNLAGRFPLPMLKACLAVPLELQSNGTLVIAVGDPLDHKVRERLSLPAGLRPAFQWADPRLLAAHLAQLDSDSADLRWRSAPAAAQPSKPGASSEGAATAEFGAPEASPAPQRKKAAAEFSEAAASPPRTLPPPPLPPVDHAGAEPVPEAPSASAAPEPGVQDAAAPSPPPVRTRRTTVNYFRKMYVQSNYPLSVLVADGEVTVRGPTGSTTTTGSTWHVDEDATTVTLIPCFPGCLTVPDRHLVDVAQPRVEANFYVTPLAEGRLSEASVQVWQDGRCIDSLATPSRVTKQTITKIATAFTILVGLSIALVRFRSSSLAQSIFENLPALKGWGDRVEQWSEFAGGVANFGLLVTGALTLVTSWFYFDRRPAEADPVEREITPDAGAEQP